MRWHKFPATNGLLGAFIKTQPDSLDDSDLRGPPHRRQPIPSTSPVPAVWLRALRRCTEDRGSSRNWEGSDVRVRTIVSFALSRTGALVIAHPAFLARSESVILALACRVRIILHPRNTQVCDGHRQLRCAGIKYGSRDRKHGLRVHGTAWRSKWQGEPGARNPCLAPGSPCHLLLHAVPWTRKPWQG